MVSFSYLIEVFLNALGDLLGFTWAVSGNKPFHRIAVALLIIASVVVVAQRNNVVWGIATTFSYWYPVILCKGMPQTSRSTANSTTIAKVFEATLPVLDSKVGSKFPFNRSAAMGVSLALVFVSYLPFSCCRCLFIRMAQSPFSIGLFLPFGKSISVLFGPNSHLLFVFRSVLSFVCGIVYLVVCMTALFVFVGLIPVVGTSAINTNMPHFVAAFREKLKSIRKEFTASKASIFGNRHVQHSVSLSLYHMMLSADGVIRRRFGCTALADTFIVSQKGNYIHV